MCCDVVVGLCGASEVAARKIMRQCKISHCRVPRDSYAAAKRLPTDEQPAKKCPDAEGNPAEGENSNAQAADRQHSGGKPAQAQRRNRYSAKCEQAKDKDIALLKDFVRRAGAGEKFNFATQPAP